MTDRITQKEVNKIASENAAMKIVDCYKRLFGREDGKRVLANLAKVCSYEISNDDGEFNPNKVMFREGQRSVYIHINDMIRLQEKKNG